MAPSILTTQDEPQWHFKLTDADSNTLGFILCDGDGTEDETAVTKAPAQRTILATGGGGRYDDFDYPWRPIPQDDWSGGRAQEEFERDRSRFFDSYRALTSRQGGILSGPQETYTSGHRDMDQSMPGSTTFATVTDTVNSKSFVASSSYSAAKIMLWVRKVGTPNAALTVTLHADSGGSPGSVLKTVTLAVADQEPFQSELVVLTWPSVQALSATTTYHIGVAGSAADDATDHWEVGTDGSDPYFRMVAADVAQTGHLFRYKGAQYFVTRPDSDGAATLEMNGDRGVATGAQTSTTLKDSTKSWTVNQWAGAVVKIVDGTGKGFWRAIASNTSDTLTVAAWGVTPTAGASGSAYVILGSDVWSSVTSGLTAGVTDVLVVKDMVLFAQGSTIAHRYNEFNSSGTWTRQNDADGSNTADFFEKVRHYIDGLQVWRAQNSDTNGDVSVSRATAVNFSNGGDLAFGTEVPVGDQDALITGLTAFGSPKELTVMKEDSAWFMTSSDVPEQMDVDEMSSVASENNGVNPLVHNVYLYFPLLHSVERFYRNNLDDVGPSRDAGLPSGRQGPVVSMVGYAGKFWAAVDAGSSGYSSILENAGRDWHEVYRAPKGERIRAMSFEVIPGPTQDRLWFMQGNDLVWLGHAAETRDPFYDTNARFTHESTVTSSWIYANLQDVPKFFNSLKLFTEGLVEDAQYVEAEWQTDDDTAWTAITGTFFTVPTQEISLSAANAAVGRRLRFRVRLITTDNTKSPRVKATVLESLTRIDPKYRYNVQCRIEDLATTLEGDDDPNYTSVQQAELLLLAWGSSTVVPLSMIAVFDPMDTKTVLLDLGAMRPIFFYPGEEESHVLQFNLIEV
jgi:hypothetical protein